MLVFKLALLAGACACVAVAGASWNAGYPPEVALTRGVVGFVGMCALGFLGQLTAARGVTTAPSTSAPPTPVPPAGDHEPTG